MATLETLEGSVESSRPIELFELILGSTVFRYTSAEDTLTPGVDAFTPLAIHRGQIRQGSEQNNRNLIITMPAETALAQQYVIVPPGEKVTMNLFSLVMEWVAGMMEIVPTVLVVV